MDEYDDMWSDLGKDLLGTICEALTIPYIYSFASVCRSWRNAAALKDRRRNLLRFNLQKPWLVFSENDANSPTFANFYSISDGRFFAMEKEPDASLILPSLNKCFVIGSDHGWMIVADERSELVLVNPMTRKQIALPPVSTLDIVTPKFGNDYGLKGTYYSKSQGRYVSKEYNYSAEDLRYSLYWKACLSSCPTMGDDDDYTVVILLHNLLGGFAFAKSGAGKWTMVFDVQKPLFIIDILLYHHRRHHCTSNHADNSELVLLTADPCGMVQEWDLSSPAAAVKKDVEFLPAQELDLNEYYYFYLVHTKWGDLLHVRRFRGEVTADGHYTSKIEVYRFDFMPGSQKRRLVKVES